MKITPTALTVNQLLGSANEQYAIPSYQRRYSWHERQVWELIEDIKLIEDGDTHLLGSIVCLAGHHTAGLNRLELVDGQQRITTISILLECIKKRLTREGDTDAAADIARLLTAKPPSGGAHRKVALDSIDSSEFDRLLHEDEIEEVQNYDLTGAFHIIRDWVGEQLLDTLRDFTYRLINQATIIRLDVSEAKDAFKLFETINNRGLRLSPTDIIKNFLLGNAARFGSEALELARKSWAALIVHLDGTNSDAFFRYYLMADAETRVTASQVVANFKKVFMVQVQEAKALPERHLYPDAVEEDEEDQTIHNDEPLAQTTGNGSHIVTFKEFLAQLVLSAKVYAELVSANTGNAAIDRHLRNLRMIKAVQTYGFLMHLRVGGCSEKEFREVLKLTESFVLRRHVCRERSNETESLFANLCGINPTESLEAVKVEYRKLCPPDVKFQQEFSEASFSGNLIDRARYCLERIEASRHGDYEEIHVLGADDVHVEHIMPQKISTKKARDEFGDWMDYLGKNADSSHSRYVNRIGNLTLFSGELNISASNNPFGRKKPEYKKSAILLTQEIGKLAEFKFKTIEKRSKDLSAVALELWPMP